MNSTGRGTKSRDSIHEFHQDAGVLQNKERLIARRPVAKVKSQLDIIGDGRTESRELLEHRLFVVRFAYGKIVLEQQYFLAHVELDRQVLVRNDAQDVAQRLQQRAFIGAKIAIAADRTDIHQAGGHRRRQGDLQAHVAPE